MITVMFLVIVSSVSISYITPVLRARDVDMAVRTVVWEMGRARQLSVDRRRDIRVTLATPRSITTAQRVSAAWTQVSQVELPGDMEFRIGSGVSDGPSDYGSLDPINLCGQDFVYFLPDGSAIDSTGQICSGVVYLARANELETSRAVTLFGSTGKMKRWRYVEGLWESP
jgi:hypothetical protein